MTVSRVETATPPFAVCAGVVWTSSSARSWRSGCCDVTLESVRRRVNDFARGSGLPDASTFGSLPAVVSTANGASPAKMPLPTGATAAPL